MGLIYFQGQSIVKFVVFYQNNEKYNLSLLMIIKKLSLSLVWLVLNVEVK